MKTKHFLRTLALSGLIVSIFTISGCKERESNSSSLTQNNVSLTEDSSKPIEEVSSSLNSSENTLVDSSFESSSTISSLEENSSTEESSSSNNQNNIERDEGVIYKDATFVYDGNPHLHTVNTINKAKGTNYQIKYYSDEACTSELTGFIEVGTYKAYAKLTDLNGLYDPFVISSNVEVLPNTNAKTLSYKIDEFEAGKQYAKDEVHNLSNFIKVTTTQCHFTTEIRIYSSSSHNGVVYIEASYGKIHNLLLNIGNNNDDLVVYGSNTNEEGSYEDLGVIKVTSDYQDVNFDLLGSYKYIKLDVKNNAQVRIKNLGFIFLQDEEISPLKLKQSEAENEIDKLKGIDKMTKVTYESFNTKYEAAKTKVEEFIQMGGNDLDLENYDLYSEAKDILEDFTTNKTNSFNEANEQINLLNSFIENEGLYEDSSLTKDQFEELKSLYAETKAYIDEYSKYGEESELNDHKTIMSTSKILLDKYEDENGLKHTLDNTYDFEKEYLSYKDNWTSSNANRIVYSGMMTVNALPLKMDFINANARIDNNITKIRFGSITLTGLNDTTINSFSIKVKKISNNVPITLNYVDAEDEEKVCGYGIEYDENDYMEVTSTKLPLNTTRVVIDFTSGGGDLQLINIKVNGSTLRNETVVEKYYASIIDTYKGETLWTKLETLLTNTNYYTTTYGDNRYLARFTDVNPSNPNEILDFYSRQPIDSTWDPKVWNREHLWCQSKAWYPDNLDTKDGIGGGSDIHHIRPLIANINSSRNNSQYGEITNRDNYIKTFNGYNYGYLNSDQSLGTGNGVFEPLDNIKGDVARILLYLLVRYKTKIEEPNAKDKQGQPLSITRNVYTPNGTKQEVYELLLKWNKNDPVDDLERARNNQIYTIQGNRNPFIDNPGYADLIFKNL